jgi:hypothetical protein
MIFPEGELAFSGESGTEVLTKETIGLFDTEHTAGDVIAIGGTLVLLVALGGSQSPEQNVSPSATAGSAQQS